MSNIAQQMPKASSECCMKYVSEAKPEHIIQRAIVSADYNKKTLFNGLQVSR